MPPEEPLPAEEPMPVEDPLPRRKWLLLGVPICLVMTVVEVLRAFDGNTRSIAYSFEWPFFAIFLVYMYRKLGQPLPNWDDEKPGPPAE